MRVATQYAPPLSSPVGRQSVKVVSESLVTGAIFVPILVFLYFSILELRPMYATDRRQTDVRQADFRQTSDVRRQIKASLNAPVYYGGA